METPAVVTSSRLSGIDWGAILAGAALAAGIGLVLNAFGAALGLGTISAEPGEGSVNLALIVSGLWVVLSTILTYMAGGYVAGRMRRRGETMTDDETAVRDGVHGLVVWALGMIATAWIAASILGAVTSTLGNVAGSVAEGAGSAVASGVEAAGQAMSGEEGSEGDSGVLGWIGDSLTRPSAASVEAPEGTADPAELTRQSAAILANVARTGEISDEERSFLTAATVRVTGITPAEAEARTEQAVTAAQSLRAEAESLAASARDAAETARKGAVLTAFLLAAASLVAGAAAVAGGVYGGRHRDDNRFFGGFAYRH